MTCVGDLSGRSVKTGLPHFAFTGLNTLSNCNTRPRNGRARLCRFVSSAAQGNARQSLEVYSTYAFAALKSGHSMLDSCNMPAESVQNTLQLGNSDLQVSRLGLGSLQWGDTQQGFNSRFNEVGDKSTKEGWKGAGACRMVLRGNVMVSHAYEQI